MGPAWHPEEEGLDLSLLVRRLVASSARRLVGWLGLGTPGHPPAPLALGPEPLARSPWPVALGQWPLARIPSTDQARPGQARPDRSRPDQIRQRSDQTGPDGSDHSSRLTLPSRRTSRPPAESGPSRSPNEIREGAWQGPWGAWGQPPLAGRWGLAGRLAGRSAWGPG